jgi:hypothetical protein
LFGLPEMSIMLDSTPAAGKPVSRLLSNEHPIKALSYGVYLPNFISLCLEVRHGKMPTHFGPKKRKEQRKKKEKKKNIF